MPNENRRAEADFRSHGVELDLSDTHAVSLARVMVREVQLSLTSRTTFSQMGERGCLVRFSRTGGVRLALRIGVYEILRPLESLQRTVCGSSLLHQDQPCPTPLNGLNLSPAP